MIREPARDIPVFRQCDVLVVGGGPAGCAAAVAASRVGADVVLAERYGHLGGMSTGGLVVYIERMTDWNTGQQLIAGFANDVLERIPKDDIIGPPKELWGSREPDAVRYWEDRHNAHHGIVTWSPTVEPERLKIVSNDLVLQNGVKLLMHSWGVAPIIEGDEVRGVIFEGKSGRQAILAKVVIDATGDGDIFALAGVPFEGDIIGEDIHHTVNTAFRFGGVDMERYHQFRRGNRAEFDVIMARGALEGVRDRPHRLPRNDVVVFMGPRLSGYSCINVEDLTAVEVESRRLMLRILDFYKKNVPGFESAWLLDTASQLGTRHSRRLIGVKKVTRPEWLQNIVQDDEIGVTPPANPADPNVSIPLGCLLPTQLDGLMAAGRSLSCDAASHTFLRLVPQCWEMGQGAGVAAAVAVNAGAKVRNVDVKEVQRLLLKQGVYLQKPVEAATTVPAAPQS
jgi:hypothetical protein